MVRDYGETPYAVGCSFFFFFSFLFVVVVVVAVAAVEIVTGLAK